MKFSIICFALSALATTNAFSVFAPSNGVASKSALNVMSGKSPGEVSKTAEWNINQIATKATIQGQSRHTYNFSDNKKELVQVAIHSNGRPISTGIDLWIGPDWTPVKVKANSEDGKIYPIQTLIGTRNQAANIEVQNTGPYTMPIQTAAAYAIDPLAAARDTIAAEEEGKYMEGGSVKHMSFSPEIDQLQVLIKTEGKQLNAKIELLKGPNTVKQEYEIFTNNGALNALFVVFDTPGEGNAIRVKNLATLEYPCEIYAKASKVGTSQSGMAQWSGN